MLQTLVSGCCVGLCHSFQPAATRGAGTTVFGIAVASMGLPGNKQAGVRFPVLGKQNAAFCRLDDTARHRLVCLSLPLTGKGLSLHISGNLHLCWSGTSGLGSLADRERTGMLRDAAFPLQGAGRNTSS